MATPEPNSNHAEVSIKQPIEVNVKIEKDEVPKPINKLSPEVADLIKWLFGTLILGVLGWYTNYKISSTQILKQDKQDSISNINSMRDADAKIITAISGRFDSTFNGQVKYLQYIRPFVNGQQLRDSISMLIRNIHSYNNLHDTLSKVIQKSTAVKYSKEQSAKFNQIGKGNGGQSMDELLAREKSIAGGQDAQVSPQILTTIESAKIATVPTAIKSFVIVGTPVALYAKEGYYANYNNVLKIGINQLDVKNQRVFVKITAITSGRDSLLNDNVSILVGKTYEQPLLDQDIKYVISLDYIGSGGFNPFTKAAYMTVTTYQKK